MLKPVPDPDISIVIPTRNRARLLDRLLTQLGQLSPGPTYEFIVVDEGSSDDTSAVLDHHAALLPLTVLRNDQPRGAAAARNLGIESSGGRFVAWIDDDDLTAPDRLRVQHEILTRTEFEWSCAATVDIDEDLQIVGHRRGEAHSGTLPSLLRFNSLPSPGQGVLASRALLEEVGVFDETLPRAMDWELCIRMASHSTGHVLDDPLVGYSIGHTSLSSTTAVVESSIRSIAVKHSDLYRAQQVELDWAAIHQSLLLNDLRASRSTGARRAAAIFASSPSPRTLAGLGAAFTSPNRMIERSIRRRREQVPSWWANKAKVWLEDVQPGTWTLEHRP